MVEPPLRARIGGSRRRVASATGRDRNQPGPANLDAGDPPHAPRCPEHRHQLPSVAPDMVNRPGSARREQLHDLLDHEAALVAVGEPAERLQQGVGDLERNHPEDLRAGDGEWWGVGYEPALQQLDADLVTLRRPLVQAATSCAKNTRLRSTRTSLRACSDRSARSSSLRSEWPRPRDADGLTILQVRRLQDLLLRNDPPTSRPSIPGRCSPA